MSPKSPRIELSNDTFAERKCCQVSTYESETFHRRRPNGWNCENEELNPQNMPLPFHDVDPPSNTAMPRPTARTTPNRSFDGWGTVAHRRRKVFIGFNGAPQICPQKYPFLRTDPQTPLPASSLDASDLWCQTASGSDPPFFHKALDRQTDRSTTGKFDHYRPLRSESDAA